MFLIAGLDSLCKEGEVETVSLPQMSIFPGKSVVFQFKGIRYGLRATGGSHVLQENPIDEYIWNYKLYLTAEINGKQTEELLVAARSFDDAMITILFAGDMDRDGKLDLLIDVSNHYNVSSPTLYYPSQPNLVIY